MSPSPPPQVFSRLSNVFSGTAGEERHLRHVTTQIALLSGRLQERVIILYTVNRIFVHFSFHFLLSLSLSLSLSLAMEEDSFHLLSTTCDSSDTYIYLKDINEHLRVLNEREGIMYAYVTIVSL